MKPLATPATPPTPRSRPREGHRPSQDALLPRGQGAAGQGFSLVSIPSRRLCLEGLARFQQTLVSQPAVALKHLFQMSGCDPLWIVVIKHML